MKLTNIVSLAFLIFLFGMMSCNVLDTEPFESYLFPSSMITVHITKHKNTNRSCKKFISR